MIAISPVIEGHEQFEVKIAESQEEYQTLPALLVGHTTSGEQTYVQDLRDASYIITCFELSDEEIATLIRTRRLYYYQHNFGRRVQPLLISAEAPAI